MFRTVMDSACSGDSVGARLDTDDNNDDAGGRRLLAATERKSRARCIVEQPRRKIWRSLQRSIHHR